MYHKKLAAEHPIGTLSPCGTSIVSLLPAEFEPLTVATVLMCANPGTPL
jgi:hypothetical protein